MKTNFSHLKKYSVIDRNGKIHNDNWLQKFHQMYIDEPVMKNTLVHALIQFTLSRYDGNVNCPAIPKLIAFFQTLHAYSPRLYNVFKQNLGGYNERTLRRMAAIQAPQIPIIDCSPDAIKNRASKWIEQIRDSNNPNEIIIASVMADATKVPPRGEFRIRDHFAES